MIPKAMDWFSVLMCFPREIQEQSKPPFSEEQTKNERTSKKGVEYLQLSVEEAFFLAYSLGCLRITTPSYKEVLLSLYDVPLNFNTYY